MSSGLTPGGRNHSVRNRTERGFTLIEAMIVVVIIVVMTVMALPLMQSTLAFYDLQGAVSLISGSMQSTRYRAISDGYPYTMTLDSAAHTLQLAKCPSWDLPTKSCPDGYTSENKIPFSSAVQLNANVVLQFFPSGNVSFTTGNNPIGMARGVGSSTKTKSITVSNYGSIKVQ